MREKLASIRYDVWIEDEEGERAYRMNGNAVRMRDTFEPEDASGSEVSRLASKVRPTRWIR